MSRTFLTPLASDPVERIADWVELQVLFTPEHQFSLDALSRVINRSGSTDALPNDEDELDDADPDAPPAAMPRPHRHPGDESRAVAEAAFAEIDTRTHACKGERDAYPFIVEPGFVKLKGDLGASDYEFFLLLSYTEPTKGHDGTAVLFEHLCGAAALGHLGGRKNRARAFRFGAPRRRPIAKLSEAITELCAFLGEGAGCSKPKKASHTGDAQLDIVAFRGFPDGRKGKLILFGQCGAGAGFEDKLSELQPRNFVKEWLREPLLVDPLRVFFVPVRVIEDDWESTVIHSGVLFDRCRIAACIEQEQYENYKGAIVAANKNLMKALAAGLTA
jgi:hypothetical protein